MSPERANTPRWVEISTRLGVLAVVIGGVVRPFFLSTWYGNDEVDRYPGRLELLYRHISLAEPLPRWIPELAGGHGYPLFNFFNAGSMAVALPFRALGFDAFLSLKLALIVMLAFGGLHAMWLGDRLIGRRAGLPAACLYLLAPYTIANLYHRGDFAEAWAMLLFPAVLYHALRTFEGGRARHALMLAACWAMLVPAHAFSALLFATAFAVFFVVKVGRDHHRGGLDRRHGIVVAASVLGVAMAAIYWLPALAEKGTVRIDAFFSVERLMGSALSVGDLLDPSPDGRIAAPRRLTLGGLIPALGLAALALSLARRRWPGRGRLIALACATAFCLLMTTRAAEPIYRHVPLIGQILFPYRFLSLATFFAVPVAAALPGLLFAERPRLVGPAALALAGLALVAARPHLELINPQDFPPEHADYAARAEREFIHFDYGEYFPSTVQREPQAMAEAPHLAGDGCVVEGFTFEGLEMAFTVTAERACAVTLAQLRWIGWEARIGGEPAPIGHDLHGRMVLSITPGTHAVQVFRRPTKVQRTAKWVSAFAFALFSLIAIVALVVRLRARLAHGPNPHPNPLPQAGEGALPSPLVGRPRTRADAAARRRSEGLARGALALLAHDREQLALERARQAVIALGATVEALDPPTPLAQRRLVHALLSIRDRFRALPPPQAGEGRGGSPLPSPTLSLPAGTKSANFEPGSPSPARGGGSGWGPSVEPDPSRPSPPTPTTREGRHVSGVRAALPLLVVLALALFAFWPRARLVASTNSFLGGDPTFGAERAIDGLDTTAWLEHDGSPGWLEVTLLPGRTLREIELVNVNRHADDERSTERYRLELYAEGERVEALEGRLDVGGIATHPLPDRPWVDLIRFEILSRRGPGGGLQELRVR